MQNKIPAVQTNENIAVHVILLLTVVYMCSYVYNFMYRATCTMYIEGLVAYMFEFLATMYMLYMYAQCKTVVRKHAFDVQIQNEGARRSAKNRLEFVCTPPFNIYSTCPFV